MTEPVDRVVDLVERTLTNLDIVDEMALDPSPGLQVFEVTQMVNSLLSLLVIPHELGTVDYVGKAGVAPHVHRDGIRKWHQGSVRFRLDELEAEPPSSLKKLLAGLRHSVAHSDFQSVPTTDRVIKELQFTSRSRARTPLWSVTFELGELRLFLRNLSDELRSARKRQLEAARLPKPSAREPTLPMECELPISAIERIDDMVASRMISSRGRFIQEAVEAKLRDEGDLTAA